MYCAKLNVHNNIECYSGAFFLRSSAISNAKILAKEEKKRARQIWICGAFVFQKLVLLVEILETRREKTQKQMWIIEHDLIRPGGLSQKYDKCV